LLASECVAAYPPGMRMGSLDFRPALWPTVVTIVLFALLLGLGFWQLDRADQKKTLLDQYRGKQESSVLRLAPGLKSTAGLNYRRATVAGHYDSRHQLLLDNRTHAGRVGYEVLTPLVMEDSRVAILVNRGWIPLVQSRDILPDVTVPEHRRKLVGRIKVPPGKVFMLGREVPRRDWPWRIQQIHLDKLSAELGRPLLPVILRLDAGEPDGYVRDWKPTPGFGPERNIAYAVQWFGLAITLLIIYLVVNTRKVNNDT